MAPQSLEQTLFKLRERVSFLERANQSLGADRSRLLAEFAEIEKMIGGCGGLSLAGAVANRIARIDRVQVKRERASVASQSHRLELLRDRHPRDTGAISDDVFAELVQ